jgi:hypothetical protein
MTKTCFGGGCTKAYAGARATEYGPSAKRTNATRSCPAHRSWSRTCALPPVPSGRAWPAEEAKSKHKRISAGQRNFFRNPSRAPNLVPGVPSVRLPRALGLRSTPSARQIRAQAASDAPHASFDSATVEPKQAGHTHACHKAFVQGLAKPGFARSAFLIRSMARCLSVVPGLVRVRVALMSLRCLAIFSCGLLAVSLWFCGVSLI